MRRLLRFVFPRGTLTGVLVFLGLFAWSLVTREDFSAFGVRDPSVEKLVFGPFLSHVLRTQGQILLGYVAAGWILGLGVGAFVWAVPAALGRSLGCFARRFLQMAGVLVLHLLLLGRSIAEYPQLYTESLYDRGGWRARLQVWLTDLPLGAFDAVLWGLLGLLAVALFGAALRGGALTRLRERRFRARWALGAAAAAALVVGVWAFWPVRASREGPNLLVIAVDSLRADRLSAYGYGRNTPNIDRLAAEGTLFERAFVSLPRTFPSWTTLFTGRWPNGHGIRHMFPTQEERDRAPAGLPKALAAQGYRTSVVADYAGDIFTRMDYGFQEIDAPYFNFPMLISLRSFEIHKQLLPYVTNGLGRRIFPVLRELAQNADPRDLGGRALAELDRLARRGKFLLTVFFSAAHFPYASPSPYYRLYTDPAYAGASRYHKLPTLKGGDRLGPADVRHVQDLYDGAVRSVDDQVGRLLEKLDRLGAAKSTVVVLLADHGEHLHEAGLGMGHGEHLRGDQALRIPLILRGPGIPAGKRVGALVRDIDIAPTLHARLGTTPLTRPDGVDLAPLYTGKRDDLGLELYGETGLWFSDEGEDFYQRLRIPYPSLTQLGRLDERHEVVIQERFRELVLVAKHRLLQTRTHKLIYVPTREGVRYELYDLVRDPAQTRDVSREQPDLVRALKDKLFRWMLEERGVQFRREFLLPARGPQGSLPVALERGKGASG